MNQICFNMHRYSRCLKMPRCSRSVFSPWNPTYPYHDCPRFTLKVYVVTATLAGVSHHLVNISNFNQWVGQGWGRILHDQVGLAVLIRGRRTMRKGSFYKENQKQTVPFSKATYVCVNTGSPKHKIITGHRNYIPHVGILNV